METIDIEQAQREARDLRDKLSDHHHRLDTEDLPESNQHILKVQIINTTSRLLGANDRVVALHRRQCQQGMRTISTWSCASVLAVIVISLAAVPLGAADWKSASHLFLILQALIVGWIWLSETAPRWEGIPRRLTGLGVLATAVLLAAAVGWDLISTWTMIVVVILTITGAGLYLNGTPVVSPPANA